MHCSAAIRAVIVIIAILWLAPPGAVPAAEIATEQEVEALDGAIDKVLQKRIYQWRMPRAEADEKEDQRPGPIAAFFHWLGEMLSGVFEYIGELFGKLIDWLRSLFPEPDPERGSRSTGWLAPESLMLIALLALVAAVIIYGVRLILRKRSEPVTGAGPAVAVAMPDLADEKISADELPADRWLGLAREMVDKGDLRLAMRAFYLATLAKLADFELLSIEFYKSNLDYKRELDRRVHEKADLRGAFINSIDVFERTWYGLKAIDRSGLDDFAALQERIIRYAES